MSEIEFLVARPNLPVADVAASAAFYRDKLGFEVKAEMGDPPNFALLQRGGAEIALVSDESGAKSGCYVYVRGVEALHEQCAAAGLEIVYPLTKEPWGLVNFVIEDPDGHRIAFGERTEGGTA